MKLYEEIKSASDAAGETNDCGVMALAAVTGTPYSEVREYLHSKGYRKPHGGVKLGAILHYLSENGYRHKVHGVKYSADEIRLQCMSAGMWGKKSRKGDNLDGKTMTTFPRKNGKGRFICVTNGHAAAVIDGEVIDWTQGRRHQPWLAIEITE